MNTSTASAHVRRQRRAVLLAASLVALSYYAHQRRWLTRLRCALAPLSEAAGAYGEAARESGRLLRRVTADLSSFLESDGRAEVPASLRQLLRLAQCAEAQEAVSRLSTALSSGVAAGVSQAVARQGDARGVLDGVLEAASSERGRSLLAVLVSAASRQAVVAGMEASERRARQQPGAPFHADTFERLLGELDSDRGRRVAQDVISALVRGAVGTYLSETADVTYAEQVMDALSRPEHREAVGELAERVTGEAVRALVTVGAQEVASQRAARSESGTPSGTPASARRPHTHPRASPPSSPGGAPFGEGPSGTPPEEQGLQLGRLPPGATSRRASSLPGGPARATAASSADSAHEEGGRLPCGSCARCGARLRRSWAGSAAGGDALTLPCGCPGASAAAAQGSSPPASDAGSDGGGGGGCGGGADPGWAATARLALRIAAAPEARALMRDVAGAAAGASVKALVYAVPSALYNALPPMNPFRSRPQPPQRSSESNGVDAQPAGSTAQAHTRRRPGQAPHRLLRASSRLRELHSDSEEEVFHDASPVPLAGSQTELAPQEQRQLAGGAAWRGLEHAKVQGALAVALLIHTVAVMPGAAARVGLL